MAAFPVTVRRAQLSDRQAIVSLLTTPVNGTSPLDEIRTDFPGARLYTLADLQQMVQSQQAALVVAVDATAMRGWNLFWHEDGLTGHVPVTVPDAWHSVYTVTDKSLATSDRLAVVAQMLTAACKQIAATTYLWGDVKTPGNFDSFLAQFFASIPNGNCNRYYATASDFIAKAGAL